MKVADFIRSEMERPFVWGETDCCSTADRWVRIRAGFSPLERYGRTIRSRQDALRWTGADASRLQSAVLDVMGKTGFAIGQDPQAGDVGLVTVDRMRRLAMAIFDGRIWTSRDPDGFICASARYTLCSWRVPWPIR
ncbi:hypothetical protein K1W69_17545 [Hoeflea sp. WL0058]|uniref:DUF6950 domain-containing protein n=1 Tax=Flavimaribacter sediminis TaxID=2865987 RepID=A0AAE3D0X5_9HYPH|nr:hypothetical protein [Flavimaribacter sediminis]MBW8639005.1 hypothetical protein [Flavimaribacter sediminis]